MADKTIPGKKSTNSSVPYWSLVVVGLVLIAALAVAVAFYFVDTKKLRDDRNQCRSDLVISKQTGTTCATNLKKCTSAKTTCDSALKASQATAAKCATDMTALQNQYDAVYPNSCTPQPTTLDGFTLQGAGACGKFGGTRGIGSTVSGGVAGSYETDTVEDCAKVCKANPKCYGINYYYDTNLCRQLTKAGLVSTGTGSKNIGFYSKDEPAL